MTDRYQPRTRIASRFRAFKLLLIPAAAVSLAVPLTWVFGAQESGHEHGGMMEHCMKVMEQRRAVLQQLDQGDEELGRLLEKVQQAPQAEQKLAALEQLVAKLVELRTFERESFLNLMSLMHAHMAEHMKEGGAGSPMQCPMMMQPGAQPREGSGTSMHEHQH